MLAYSKYPAVWRNTEISKICHFMLTSSTQLQKLVISRHGKDENVSEMYKNEHCTCKACKSIVFHCQISKLVTFLSRLLSWLRKLPIIVLFETGKPKKCQIKFIHLGEKPNILLHVNF